MRDDRRRRTPDVDREPQVVEMAEDALTAQEAAERAALQRQVRDGFARLAASDRALLDLHLRRGLDGAELGEAMGVSAARASVMVDRLRGELDRSLGALLVARVGRDDCDELDRLLVDWDGTFSSLIRRRVARHVERCAVCGERKRRMVSPWALLADALPSASALGLGDGVLDDTRHGAFELPQELGGAEGAGGHRLGARRTTLGAVALLALAVTALVLLRAQSDDAANPSTPARANRPGQSPSPTVTATRLPGTLELSDRSIDLGTTSSRATLDLFNVGDLPVDYQVASRTPWIRVASIGGTIAGSVSAQVVLGADRTRLPEGVSRGSLLVTWDGGRATVPVSVDQEDPPAVGPATVPSNSSCTVDVTTTVSDPSGLKSVTVLWSGPSGSGRTAMTRRPGSTWAARVAVRRGGVLTLQVEATDRRGNSATGSSSTTTVAPCAR